MQTRFRIGTDGPGLYEVTREVTGWLDGCDAVEGLLTLFVRHTSCSLLIQENADPQVRRDLLAWLERLVPPADDPAMSWIRHTQEGPDDMPAHIKAAMLPVSVNGGAKTGHVAAQYQASGGALRAMVRALAR